MGHDDGRLARVQDARRSLARRGPREVRSEGDFQRVSIPARDADVLRDIFLAERTARVIEIGLAYGGSALAIAEALLCVGSGNPRHVIIDAYQDQFHNTGWEAIVKAGIDETCWLIRERSQVVLPRLLGEGFVADAAFVDGSHIFHNVFVDLFYLRDLVRPGGLVVMDDYDWPSVATAARYFKINTGWKDEPIEVPTRLHAFRLPDPRPEPNSGDFQAFGVDVPSKSKTAPAITSPHSVIRTSCGHRTDSASGARGS